MISLPGYEVLATVDLGSNSFCLQISRVLDGQLYPLTRLKETVRLAAGLLPDTQCLDDATQQRALACLARFGERLRGLVAAQVRVVATNTLRVARNSAVFIRQAEGLLGFPIEIIAGREEARLVYLGAAHSLPATDERRLVVDIGGGSTEFIIGEHYQALMTESLPLGCVSYSLRYFPEGKLSKSRFREATLAARNEVQCIAHEFTHHQWQRAIGTSGTARALSDILQSNRCAATTISLAGMEQLRTELIKCGNVKVIRLSALKADRAPVLPGGLAIMIAIFEELGIDSMAVANGALRDGVLYDLLGRQRDLDMRDMTIAQFCLRYHVDGLQAQRVHVLAERLYHMVAAPAGDAEALKRLIWAAKLHEIGLTISHTGYHKHSCYILQHADMPGFSRWEQSVLATIVLGHRGNLGKMMRHVDDPPLWQAFIALRLAALFYRSRNDIRLPAALSLSLHSRGVILEVDQPWYESNPLTANAFCQEAAQWQHSGFHLEIKFV